MHRSAVALPVCLLLTAAATVSAPHESSAQSVTTTATYGWTAPDAWAFRRWWRGQSGTLAVIADVTPYNASAAAGQATSGQAGIVWVWQINPWVLGVGPPMADSASGTTARGRSSAAVLLRCLHQSRLPVPRPRRRL